MKYILAIAAIGLFSSSASTDDFGFSMDHFATLQYSSAHCAAYGCGKSGKSKATTRQASSLSAISSPLISARSLVAQEASGPAPSLRYKASSTRQAHIVKQWTQAIANSNKSDAHTVEAYFKQESPARIFKRIAGNYGLSGDDVADSMAGSLVLGWMISNGRDDVDRRAVQAVRDDIARALSANSDFRALNAAGRAELGYGFVTQFALMGGIWADMQQRGSSDLSAFSKGTADFMKTYGFDMRNMDLGRNGFSYR
ncbi:MAG: DUF6683 family protein [Pacificimonas sp.]